MAPIYLFACLILGEVGGIWLNMVLQLAGLAILAWVAADPSEALPARAKPLLLIAMAAIAVVALQTVPLPPEIWAHGIRARIADDFPLLGAPLSAPSVSLSPYASLESLLALIPPLAVFCAMTRMRAFRVSWLVTALIAGTFVGVMLNVLQVAQVSDSRSYLHVADLLAVASAFAVASTVMVRGRDVLSFQALAVLSTVVILLIASLAVTNSAMVCALAIAVFAVSVLTLTHRGSPLRRILLVVGALWLLACVASLSLSSVRGNTIGQQSAISMQSRQEILTTTGRAILDFMPFGSGLGSFARIYPLYERPDAVTGERVVHANNDYAELILELGLPGLVLIAVFLIWWGAAVRRTWRFGEGGPFVRAASIASAAVLIDSVVNSPLRAAATSAAFAMCLGLLVNQGEPRRHDRTQLRPTRHVVIA